MKEEEINNFLRDSLKWNEEQAKKMLAQKRQDEITKKLNDSGLGKRFQKRTFNTLKDTPQNYIAKTKALEFIEKFPDCKGILFQGPVGVGKTHIAAAVANELIKKLYTVVFRNAADIISTFVSTFQENNSVGELIKTFASADLLIIDDLGKERVSDFASSILYQIVNKLYEDEKPIIITTNFDSKHLIKNLGERGNAIISRITEMCEPVFMDGPDWRVKDARGN